MLRLKRLYSFILQTFLPLFLVTFGVCLFIILMQFLWKYVDEMVGKGLGMWVLAKMFFYAGLVFVPMALPLSILLASLMTFGNMGERLELLAMKSAGVSLMRIMKPILILLIFVSAGAFFFQNNILPISQVKLWTMVRSIKQKSPELDIPEGIFFKDIPGYNLYVKQKDKKTGMMRNMMIYDFSNGFENATVIVADSGSLKASADKHYLVLTLYNGESFENLKSQRTRNSQDKIPYRRESFSLKEILIEFDANFNMADESAMQNRDISKNIDELRQSIDSIGAAVDSVNTLNVRFLRSQMGTITYNSNPNQQPGLNRQPPTQVDTVLIGDFDSFFVNQDLQNQLEAANRARSKVSDFQSNYHFNAINQSDQGRYLRGHQIELHRKFALSFACLVFFFIGAPLGAIIRKGGLGMPTVISVILFLFYYTIDIFGVKMARQGVWPIWQGMWLSSFILLALGIFLTYKAVNDSVMFNSEVWVNFFKRIIGKKEVRNYVKKDVIMTYPDYHKDLDHIASLDEKARKYLDKNNKFLSYTSFWKNGFDTHDLNEISSEMEELVEDLRNSDENFIIGKLMDYPVIRKKKSGIFENPGLRKACAIIFPIGILIYFVELYRRKGNKNDVAVIGRVNQDLTIEIQKFLERSKDV